MIEKMNICGIAGEGAAVTAVVLIVVFMIAVVVPFLLLLSVVFINAVLCFVTNNRVDIRMRVKYTI